MIYTEAKMAEIPKGTLFITGGSNGIGEAIVQRVSQKYLRVANYDFSADPEMDVRNYSTLKKYMAAHLTDGQFQNDLVVSAGVHIAKPFLEQTPEQIQFQLGTNLEGAILTVHSFLRWHMENHHPIPPNIVIISSISAHLHEDPSVAVYEASKAGLSHFVKSLVDPKHHFIINAIEPGTIRRTKIGGWTPELGYDHEARRRIEDAQESEVSNLGVEVTKEDIARVCERFLFENQKGIENGSLLPVDGGWRL